MKSIFSTLLVCFSLSAFSYPQNIPYFEKTMGMKKEFFFSLWERYFDVSGQGAFETFLEEYSGRMSPQEVSNAVDAFLLSYENRERLWHESAYTARKQVLELAEKLGKLGKGNHGGLLDTISFKIRAALAMKTPIIDAGIPDVEKYEIRLTKALVQLKELFLRYQDTYPAPYNFKEWKYGDAAQFHHERSAIVTTIFNSAGMIADQIETHRPYVLVREFGRDILGPIEYKSGVYVTIISIGQLLVEGAVTGSDDMKKCLQKKGEFSIHFERANRDNQILATNKKIIGAIEKYGQIQIVKCTATKKDPQLQFNPTTRQVALTFKKKKRLTFEIDWWYWWNGDDFLTTSRTEFKRWPANAILSDIN